MFLAGVVRMNEGFSLSLLPSERIFMNDETGAALPMAVSLLVGADI